MSNGATFEISLYYTDEASNQISVAARTITNSPSLFPTNTHFLDFQVQTPVISATNAWAGKEIGVRLASTTSFTLQGDYWDVDNVRLTETVLPNNSFERPDTDFADPRIEGWQKSPEPAWYQGGGGFPWEQLAGIFQNTTNGSANHIDNMDGDQAAFIFALPDVALFQDFNSAGTNQAKLLSRFEPGKSYSLTIGLLGGGGGMSNGATFEFSLYYRDNNSNIVTVASRTIANNAILFPTNTHFTDFQLTTPLVRTNDSWAGKHIGVRLASTTTFLLQGGYWDVDNLRLEEHFIRNAFFESPDSTFADPRIDYWQKSSEPAWYQGGGGFPWDQLVGVFQNTTNGSPDHIENIDGEQAAFLFALQTSPFIRT